MCGISGILTAHKNNLFLKSNIKRMIGVLHHRGPDHNDFWINKDNSCVLGHNRLSILDLSKNGHQPYFVKRYAISYNGEIYNHNSLRKELGNKVLWNSSSDTETLIKCIEKWGIRKTLNKVSGMFAFAIWDKKEKKLTIARDKFGEKPIYFGYYNKDFIFASELKAIQAVKNIKFKISDFSLNEYFKRNYIPAPFSIYQNFFKLLPGHMLQITENEINKYNGLQNILSKMKKWDLEKKSNYKYKNIEENISSILNKSVKEKLISDVPIGCFLSGGIDSTIISYFASQNKKLNAFCIRFKDKTYDEGKYAKKVSKILNLKLYEKICTKKDLKKNIKKIPKIYDEPFSDSSQLPTLVLSEFAKKKVTVILSGDGGDEIFGGYNRYFLLNKFWNLSCFLPRFFVKNLFGTLKIIPNKVLKVFFTDINVFKIQKIIYAFSKSSNLIDFYNHVTMDMWTRSCFKKIKINNFNINKIYLKKNDEKINLNDLIYLDTKISLPDDILCKVDRASMSKSLEVRAPFLNKKLKDYLNFLPKEKRFLIQNKFFLKEILKKKFDENFLNRPKMGFKAPIDQWIKKDLNYLFLKFLDKKFIKKQNIFDIEFLKKIYNEHVNDKKNWEKFLWSYLIFQLWYEKNKRFILI